MTDTLPQEAASTLPGESAAAPAEPATASGKRWDYLPHDSGRIESLARALPCSYLMAQVLVARGIDEAEARLLMKNTLKDLHDPSGLPGLDDAADRIAAAVRDGRLVTIYGDYDVDGMTATAILLRCLQLGGGRVEYYIPHRLEEGYSLNEAAIRQLHEADPDQLVVTVDCGIASLDEATLAKELGLELIVTDHHEFADELPAAACVHPRLPPGDASAAPYPFGELCGAGVALKLAWGVSKRLHDGRRVSEAMQDYLIEAVGLTALGTVADMVPLRSENRVIVCQGLRSLSRRVSPGIRALKAVAGIESDVTADDIGFGIAPRLNAAGRLGQSRLAVELLVTDDQMRAHELARYIDELNKQRQTVERRIAKQAREQIDEHPEWADDAALVMHDEDWHPGVIGIVAGRMVDKFSRPCFLLTTDKASGELRGSGRSGGAADLHAALSACREHLTGYGGHAAAAGVNLRPENLDAFRAALSAEVLKQRHGRAVEIPLAVDAEVHLTALDLRAVKDLDRLGPFGQQHRRPVFVATDVEVSGPPKRMGGGDRHLSARFRQGNRTVRAVAFGRGDWADELPTPGDRVDICFSPKINCWQDRESVEMELIDWRPAHADAGAGAGAGAVASDG